ALVSVMLANNETGILFPVDEVAQICRARRVPLHVDAVQAAGKVALDLARTGADYASISGHKLHGPKGIGAIFIRRGAPLEPLLAGGHQEHGRRGGTENVPGIVGLGVACRLAARHLREGGPAAVARLRDRLEARILAIPGARRNGAAEPRVPNTSSVRFAGIDGEALVLELSRAGIAAATGAACASGTLEPSHVLLAMGLSPAEARGSLRLSLSRDATEAEVDAAARAVEEIVPRLRRASGAAVAG
ncbi:MAG TPA: aminotransferase class V-fold PLP-dependent enzyme, partial [Planctomycetota bacterium]|nr:aminotransferase class V-fold PLP-dependent enzyme [Planctomycetota bacterium]